MTALRPPPPAAVAAARGGTSHTRRLQLTYGALLLHHRCSDDDQCKDDWLRRQPEDGLARILIGEYLSIAPLSATPLNWPPLPTTTIIKTSPLALARSLSSFLRLFFSHPPFSLPNSLPPQLPCSPPASSSLSSCPVLLGAARSTPVAWCLAAGSSNEQADAGV